MKLEQLLLQKSANILTRWFTLILETYPPDAKRFLEKQKDPFANPVGTTVKREIETLYRELVQGSDPAEMSACLDRIVRIRAVQDYSPSKAVAFVFLLKKAVRESLGKALQEPPALAEWSVYEARIDEAALLAFDVYMTCREKIYEIRANEAKNQVSRLLKRAGLMAEIPEWNSESKEGPSKNHEVIS